MHLGHLTTPAAWAGCFLKSAIASASKSATCCAEARPPHQRQHTPSAQRRCAPAPAFTPALSHEGRRVFGSSDFVRKDVRPGRVRERPGLGPRRDAAAAMHPDRVQHDVPDHRAHRRVILRKQRPVALRVLDHLYACTPCIITRDLSRNRAMEQPTRPPRRPLGYCKCCSGRTDNYS